MGEKKIRILVTGCAGFIGSHLCEKLLSLGCEVVGIDNFDPFYPSRIKKENMEGFIHHPQFTFFKTDLEQSEFHLLLQDIPLDLVVHLAGKAGVRPSIADPGAYINSNIKATQQVLELMKQKGIKKLVFASSSSVYGNIDQVPFSEQADISEPISPYAFTKRSCELLNHTYHHLYDIDIVNLRFFTVFGPRQRPDLAIHKFTKMIVANEPIPVFGDGNTARDYTYIADIVEGCCKAIDFVWKNQKVFENINLGNNTPVPLNQLIRELEEVLETKVQRNSLPMQEGDVNVTWADISKAEKLLNYKPTTSIKEGLSQFVEWFHQSQNKINVFDIPSPNPLKL